MKKMITKTLLASAVTAVCAFSANIASAQSFPDFTVNESVIAGTATNQLTADKITGNYVEIITFNGAASSGTFDVSLKWNAGQFVANDGKTPVTTQLGSFGESGYGLYALYKGTGTYTNNGSQTVFNFTPGGTLALFTDANNDTSFTAPTTGAGGYTTGNTSDDKAIANGVPTSGQGTLTYTATTCPSTGVAAAGINCGSFGASSTFALTDFGKTYFVAPSPFYQLSFQSGQLNNFTATGTQTINGSLDVVFGGNAVPEPASVALIGLGLVGLGLSRRRKQA